MKTYGDLDDQENDVNGQGCLQQALVALSVILAAVIVTCCAAGCRSCACPPDMADIYQVLSAP